MTHLRSSALAALLAAGLLVSGCGGGDDSDKGAAGPTPAEVMDEAKQKFDDASSVHIELATESTPSEGNGVLGANGDLTHDPAFEGEVKIILNGLTATAPIIAVDDKVYAQIALLGPGYRVIKPSEYGAPDPADFADPDEGLSSLLTQLDGLEKGKESRSGDQILTTYTGELPGEAVKRIIPSADAKQTYETVIGVDEDGYARTVEITGTFFSGSDDVTYDVELSAYDEDVEITAPPTS